MKKHILANKKMRKRLKRNFILFQKEDGVPIFVINEKGDTISHVNIPAEIAKYKNEKGVMRYKRKYIKEYIEFGFNEFVDIYKYMSRYVKTASTYMNKMGQCLSGCLGVKSSIEPGNEDEIQYDLNLIDVLYNDGESKEDRQRIATLVLDLFKMQKGIDEEKKKEQEGEGREGEEQEEQESAEEDMQKEDEQQGKGEGDEEKERQQEEGDSQGEKQEEEGEQQEKEQQEEGKEERGEGEQESTEKEQGGEDKDKEEDKGEDGEQKEGNSQEEKKQQGKQEKGQEEEGQEEEGKGQEEGEQKEERDKEEGQQDKGEDEEKEEEKETIDEILDAIENSVSYGGGEGEHSISTEGVKAKDIRKELRSLFKKLAFERAPYGRTDSKQYWDGRKLVRAKFNPLVMPCAKSGRDLEQNIYFVLDDSGSMYEHANMFSSLLESSKDVVKVYTGSEAHPCEGVGIKYEVEYNHSFYENLKEWLTIEKPEYNSVLIFWGDTCDMHIRGEENKVRKLLRNYRTYWLGTRQYDDYYGWEQPCLEKAGFKVIAPVTSSRELAKAVKKIK